MVLKSFLLTDLIFKEKVSAFLDWGMLLFCVTVTPPSLHHFPADRSEPNEVGMWLPTVTGLLLPFPKLSFLSPSPSAHLSFLYFSLDFCGLGFLFCHSESSTELPLAPGVFCSVWWWFLFSSVGSLHFSFRVHTWEAAPPVLIHSWGSTLSASLHTSDASGRTWVQVGHPAGRAATRWQFKRDLWGVYWKSCFQGVGRCKEIARRPVVPGPIPSGLKLFIWDSLFIRILLNIKSLHTNEMDVTEYNPKVTLIWYLCVEE